MRKFRCALLIVGIDAMRRFTQRATAAILTPSQLPPAADIALKSAMAAVCRYCCKSLFALLIKNSLVGFRVKMRGTSYYDDKLVSDLAKATEATKISARQSDRLMAGKLSPLNIGLLQQNRHAADIPMLPIA